MYPVYLCPVYMYPVYLYTCVPGEEPMYKWTDVLPVVAWPVVGVVLDTVHLHQHVAGEVSRVERFKSQNKYDCQ